MKRCPKCNRTYADDAFTFCLEDGALLSAPYDPEKKEEPISTIQSGGPPPTAVLPYAPTSSEQAELNPTPLPATVASPVREQFEQSSQRASKRSLLRLIAIPAVALILIVTAFSFYSLKKASCPTLEVRCRPGTNVYTDCLLLVNGGYPISDAAEAAMPISETKWTVSPRTGSSRQEISTNYALSIDATSLAGQQITVTATVSSKNWFCSQTASTSYVVPQASAPLK